ncbi:MAG: glutathione S-transferase family protein [Thermoleophilia bacterium]
MSGLVLWQHPFASYCQKVLIALDELGLAFTPRLVEGQEGRAALAALWPPAGIPVLQDEDAGLTLPESSTIIEYLDDLAPGGPRLIPADPAAALQARLWDRVCDGMVSTPMQAVVGDALRPEGDRDAFGVAAARDGLDMAYALLDGHLAGGSPWLAGAGLTLADCAAAPALHYAWVVHPWDEGGHPHLTRYVRALLARPSVARVVDGARPWRAIFPLGWPDHADRLGPPP